MFGDVFNVTIRIVLVIPEDAPNIHGEPFVSYNQLAISSQLTMMGTREAESLGPSWSLLGGHGADNEPAAAACRQRRLCASDGGGDERFYFGTRQDFHRFETNEARLIPGAKKQTRFIRLESVEV